MDTQIPGMVRSLMAYMPTERRDMLAQEGLRIRRRREGPVARTAARARGRGSIAPVVGKTYDRQTAVTQHLAQSRKRLSRIRQAIQ